MQNKRSNPMPFELINIDLASIDFSHFHFMRAELLWLLLPALLLIYQLKQNHQKQSAWRDVISPHLLKFLSADSAKPKDRSTFLLTGLIASLIIIAISGPSFRQKAVPVFQADHAQIILMDLSLSMDATDIKPSRLDRAKFKLMDLLEQTKEGTVALVVYAGDAFIISPLTTDANTISNIIPTLSTGIMPVLGSRPDIAIQKSIELLQNAKASRGEIIWLTDGIEQNFIEPIADAIEQTNYQLSILAIGTEQGAPIPMPDGNGFLKDSSANIVIPKLEMVHLTSLANRVDAGLVKLTTDNGDIDYLKQYQQLMADANQSDESNEQMMSHWLDDGYWLIWLVLGLFFIKLIKQPANQLMQISLPAGLLILISGTFSQPTQAIEWKDLWYTPNQQAKQAFEQKNFDQAAQLFQQKQWQAAAQYKAGQFEQAATNFADTETGLSPNNEAANGKSAVTQSSSIRSQYNHATSLAKANQLQAALDAYNQLLEQEPNHQDATFNKKIVEDMLKQQEQEKQQQQDQQQSDQEQEQNDEQQPSEQNDEQQQSDDQQQQEQQQDQQQQSEDQQTEEQKQQQLEAEKDEREKSEKDQALEHWLEKIPDDPGGLLRRKMYREYQRRGRQQKEKKLW
jgi:Ca-activated chloride channel homolog